MMKACFSIIATIVVLSAFAWGQDTQTSADTMNMHISFFSTGASLSAEDMALKRELDTMGEALGSVLALNTQAFSMQPPASSTLDLIERVTGKALVSPMVSASTGNEAIISASVGNGFYLQGQGVVLMIHISGLRDTAGQTLIISPVTNVNMNVNDMLENVRRLNARLNAPDTRHEDMVAMRHQINALQNDIRILQDSERVLKLLSAPTLRQVADDFRESLVDTLAKYGDSLSVVKPDEYINLVLQASPVSLGVAGRGTEIISVRKSWITDYKAGKMTLEEFRGKVLQ